MNAPLITQPDPTLPSTTISGTISTADCKNLLSSLSAPLNASVWKRSHKQKVGTSVWRQFEDAHGHLALVLELAGDLWVEAVGAASLMQPHIDALKLKAQKHLTGASTKATAIPSSAPHSATTTVPIGTPPDTVQEADAFAQLMGKKPISAALQKHIDLMLKTFEDLTDEDEYYDLVQKVAKTPAHSLERQAFIHMFCVTVFDADLFLPDQIPGAEFCSKFEYPSVDQPHWLEMLYPYVLESPNETCTHFILEEATDPKQVLLALASIDAVIEPKDSAGNDLRSTDYWGAGLSALEHSYLDVYTPAAKSSGPKTPTL